ncbi:MAG TPA: response regulator transcription factor [Zeimonas sp.]|nr:response regulator transcription factor [Zeimonas sp.]
MSASPSMLDAFLATVVRLTGARAGTLRIPPSHGEPEFVASWARVAEPGASDLGAYDFTSHASVVLPLESGGETLGLFTLFYDTLPGGRGRGRSTRNPRLRPLTTRMRAPEMLTARERQILSRIALGESNKAIARTLGISPDTVKLHVRHILAKLGCASRVEAAVYATQNGLGYEAESAVAVS